VSRIFIPELSWIFLIGDVKERSIEEGQSQEINQAVKITALPKKYQPRLEAGAGGSLGYVMQAFICSLGQNRRLLRYARNDFSTELAEVNLLLSCHI
jgi:hypothetical protein